MLHRYKKHMLVRIKARALELLSDLTGVVTRSSMIAFLGELQHSFIKGQRGLSLRARLQTPGLDRLRQACTQPFGDLCHQAHSMQRIPAQFKEIRMTAHALELQEGAPDIGQRFFNHSLRGPIAFPRR